MSGASAHNSPSATALPTLSVRPLLDVLRRRFGDEVSHSIVADAGLKVDRIALDGGRVAAGDANRLRIAVARRLTGASDVPDYDHPVWRLWQEVGRDELDAASAGLGGAWAASIGGPASLLRTFATSMDGKATPYVATVTNVAEDSATLTVREPSGQLLDVPATCWTVRGALVSIPTTLGLPEARVDHPACRFRGDDCCTYTVRWQPWSPAARAGLVGAVAAGIAAGAVAGSILGSTSLGAAVGGLGVAVALLTQRHRRLLAERDARLRQSDAELHAANIRFTELWRQTESLRATAANSERLVKFVPEQVAQRVEAGTDIALGGRARNVTVMFVDMAGYSTMSERLEPGETIDLLNDFFAAMTEVVRTAGGNVLEYTGDGMMVVFGATIDREDHAEAAVRCALAMHERLAELNASTDQPGAAPWQQLVGAIACRIGVHTGEVIAGNIGVNWQLKYAVVGDNVNIAARLESLNKRLGTSLLFSASTLTQLPDDLCERAHHCGAHALRGRVQAVDVYSFAKPDGDTDGSSGWRKRVPTNHY